MFIIGNIWNLHVEEKLFLKNRKTLKLLHAINTDGESMAKLLSVLALAIVILSSEACANSISLNTSLYGYLSTYIPNSTLHGASLYNLTLGRHTYAIMQLGSGANKFIVINTTKHYSVLLSAANISAVLGPFLLGRYYPNQSTLNYLDASMHSYLNQSSKPINDCLMETGLDRFTCTTDNECFSCRTIPSCGAVITSLGGPGNNHAYPFVNGIENFSSQYAQLNASYISYFSTLANISASNIGPSIQTLSSDVSMISGISTAMPQSPLFPIPTGVNLATLYASCGSYTLANQPWYCVDIGLCQYPNFNSTLLSGVQAAVTQLKQSPLSSAGLSSVSANSSSIANGYVYAVVSSEENASFSAFLNATEPKYNSTVQKSQALLAMFGNSVLSSRLIALKSTFATIIRAGESQNISAANTMLANALSATNAAYSAVYAAFSPVYTIAQSNNYLLAVDQLSYAHIPAGLASIALEQQEINARIASGVNQSQLSSVLSELRSVSSSLSLMMPFTLGSVVKALDSGTASMLLGGASSLGAKNSGAALYSAAISLIIGCLLVLVFHMQVYSKLKSKHKIKFSRRAKKAWNALFIVFGILVVVYVLVTYLAAGSANKFLPVSGFINAVTASKSFAIVLNTTSSGVIACAGSVKASLSAMGKSVNVISIVNGTCSSTIPGFSGACLGNVAGSMPLVLMSNGNSSIVYRGMYGHVLYASGAAASGASCPLDTLFSK